MDDYKKVLEDRKKTTKYSTFNTPAFVLITLVFILIFALWYYFSYSI